MLKKERQKATEKPAAIFLSKEQIRILELVQSGHSLFYTGSAGTLFLIEDYSFHSDLNMQELESRSYSVK